MVASKYSRVLCVCSNWFSLGKGKRTARRATGGWEEGGTGEGREGGRGRGRGSEPSLLLKTEEGRPRKEEEEARRTGGAREGGRVVSFAGVLKRLNPPPSSFPPSLHPSFPPPRFRLLMLLRLEGAAGGREGGREGRRGGVSKAIDILESLI